MSDVNKSLKVYKRLLQFNNLPIPFGEIQEQTYTASFKGTSTPYTNHQHGNYYGHLGEYGVLNAAQFDATLSFDFKKIACGDKPRYARFIKRQLARSGKLWAVQNGGEIIWANARVLSVNESIASVGEDKITLSVTFELIDGYWVYAWKTRTFLAQYCPSRFINFDNEYCWSYEDARCDITGKDRCLPCFTVEPEVPVDAEYKPLCSWSRTEITNLLGARCPQQFHIRYDCGLEKNFFCYDAGWGDKYRLKNRDAVNETTISFCSMTDLPSTAVQIRLRGVFVNPTITVNNDTVTLKGTYDKNTMIVAGFGVGIGLYQRKAGTVGEWNYVRSIIPDAKVTNIPYFEIVPGKNTVKITGNQLDKKSFVYIKPLEITF